MNRRITAACLLIMLSSVVAAKDAKQQTHFTDAELVSILQQEGYRAVEIDSDGIIVIRIDGAPYVLYNYDDGDLQLYYGIAGAPVTLATINQWNRTKRLTRAYIDAENDPVLESDLLSDAGLTPAHITRFVDIFLDASLLFREFIHDAGGARPDPEQLASYETSTI